MLINRQPFTLKKEEKPLKVNNRNEYIIIFKDGVILEKDTQKGYIIEEQNIKYDTLRKCACNTNLTLVPLSTNIPPPFFKDDGKDIPNIWIKFDDGNYREVLHIMPNIIHGSPDNEDPAPKGSAAATFLPPDFAPAITPDVYESDFAPLPNLNRTNKSPVVAILDTGIDLSYFIKQDKIKFPLHLYSSPCSNVQNIYGWDFTNAIPNNIPFDDDLRHKHGTRIAAIINKVTKGNVRIMSLKTANFKNEHTFFDIFCAFEYIMAYNANDNVKDEDKVKFINASWGYYGIRYRMFTHYMDKLGLRGYETQDEPNIKFVNAAGNSGDMPGYDEIEIGRQYNRYPTMYAVDYEGVYTATTVDKSNNAVENYSNVYVEVGVIGQTRQLIADGTPIYVLGSPIFLHGTFKDPLIPTKYGIIKGSSYATAYLTGLLVNDLNSGIPTDYNRRTILEAGSDDINVGIINPDNLNSQTSGTTMAGMSPL